MTLSPGDFYAEAERKMTELSTDGSTKKYDEASELFQKAGTNFSKVRNFLRAGDSFRRATDCMLHAGKLEKAAAFAAEAGRNFIKATDGGEEKSYEAFNLALKSYEELKKTVFADKLMTEASKLFEQSKKYEKALYYRNLSADSYKKQSKTQDYLRERKSICMLQISIGQWKEASKNYEELFVDLSKEGIEKNALELGVRAAICNLALADTAASRSCNERYAAINRLWGNSEETKFVKEMIMALVAKHYEHVQTIGTQFGESHGYDPSFGKIISGISTAFDKSS